MERRDGVGLGIGAIKMVGVDELEESLVIKELCERVVWIWVGEFIAGGLACSRMVEAGESANSVSYGTPGLLNNDLEKDFVVRSIEPLVRGRSERGIGACGVTIHEGLAENEAAGRGSKNGGGK